MSRYDCGNKCVVSFHRNTVNDEADVMSSGRLFSSLGPTEITSVSMECDRLTELPIINEQCSNINTLTRHHHHRQYCDC